MFTFDKALPEEMSVPSTAIRDLLLHLDEKNVPMHALLIMRKDKLIFEKYYAPYKADTLHRMFSISKSFTGLAISLLADQGKVDFDRSITDYFPEYLTADTHHWIKETTIRNMLMMRTCHASTTYKVDMKTDWVQSFFSVPPTHKPGTVFHYDTSAAHVLCALAEKITGVPMLDYLRERFLNHLDFSRDSYMIKDPFGVSMGGSGLMATPMDILKVLYVLDKKGKVICSDGCERTLINPEYIKKATSNLSDSVMTAPVPSEAMGYGMQIWQNEAGGFVLYGMGGQLAISIPSKELLIMTCADTQGMAGGNQTIYDAIYNILLPAIGTSTSPDEKAYTELMKVSDSLAISLPRLPNMNSSRSLGNLAKKLPECIFTQMCNDSSALNYKLSDNPQGFTWLHLVFSETGVSSLKLTSDSNDTNEILFGFDQMQEGHIQKYDTRYTAGAIWLRENVLYIRVHLIDECVGSLRFELYFGDNDVTVFMKKIEETYFKEYDGHLYGVRAYH